MSTRTKARRVVAALTSSAALLVLMALPSSGEMGFGVSPPFHLDTTSPGPVGHGISPPFHLDTTAPDQLWGLVTSDPDGEPIIQAKVEILHGGEPIFYSDTNENGFYGFVGINPGSYVLRASRQGFRTATTDLISVPQFGELRVDLTLQLLDPAELPDPAIAPSDLTYTVLQDGSITVTAIVHNLGQDAVDVAIRFLASDMQGGQGNTVPMGQDIIIDELPTGAAIPVSLNYTPTSGFDRFYCVLDPEDVIVEANELNNAASRNLDQILSPPVVESVTAQWDGNPSPHMIGRFMSGIPNSMNTFTATVTDPDDDVVAVEFLFGDDLVIDTNPQGGWSVTYDVGSLGTDDVVLKVTAVDAAGLRSEPKIVTIDMFEMPAWMVGNLTLEGMPSFGIEAGYLTATFSFSAGGSESFIMYLFEVDGETFMIGGVEDSFDGKFKLTLGLPLSAHLGPKASGRYVMEHTYLGHPVSSQEIGVTLNLNPDLSLDAIQVDYLTEVTLLSMSYTQYIPITPPFNVVLGIGLDLYGRLGFALGAESNLQVFYGEFTPGLSAQINGTLGLDLAYLARIEGVFSPRFNLDHAMRYAMQEGFSASTAGTWEVRWRIRACTFFNLCHDFASGAWGPYELWNERMEETREFDWTLTMPDPLAYPTMRAGPQNRLGFVWVRDMDPDTTRIAPEVMFAWADSSGQWSQPIHVTGGAGNDGFFKINPILSFEPSGRAVAAWVQNAIPEEQALRDDPSLSDVLDNQDLHAARWDGSEWTPLPPVVDDTGRTAHADGLPSLDIGPSGEGMIVWTRCLGANALEQGTRDIFYAVYDTLLAFGPPERLTDNARDDYSPAVAALHNGAVVAVWLRDVPRRGMGVSDNEVLAAVYDGVAWSEPHVLAVGDRIHRTPSAARLANGDVAACWIALEIDEDSSPQYTVVSSRWDHQTGQWDPPSSVHTSPHFLETPQMSADARNTAVITWRGHNGFDGDLFASMKSMDDPLSFWTAPDTLTNDDLTNWMLSAAVDEQNNLHFVNLVSDFADTTGQVNRGRFYDGFSIGGRGISADMRLTDDLNFGFRPLSADLKAVGPLLAPDPWPTAGVDDTLTLVMTNIGAVASTPSLVRFTQGHPDSGGVVFAEPGIPAVYPGDTLHVQAAWTPSAGSHHLWAWIDPEVAVPEQNESNNRTSITRHTVPNPRALAIWPEPDNPLPDETVQVFAVIDNAGGLDAATVPVQLTAGGAVILDTLLVDLAMGERDTLHAVIQAVPGVTDLALQVDPDSILFESNLDDNLAEANLVLLSDLAVATEVLSVEVLPDSTYRWAALVRNLGGLEAEEITVEFHSGHPLGGGTLLGSTGITTIAAGDSALVLVETDQLPGVTALYVYVDPMEEIDERTTANNLAQRDLLVELLPDLAIEESDILFDDYVGPEVPFEIVARAHNLGPAEVVAPTVHFYHGHPDSGGVLIAARLITNLPPGETREVRCLWTAPDSLDHWIWVHLDQENAVLELSDENNLAGRMLSATADVEIAEILPSRTELLRPIPNPFQNELLIRFALAEPADVSLRVFDVAGRLIRDFRTERMAPGHHFVHWDGRDDSGRPTACGVYFVRMNAGGSSFGQKAVMIR